MNYFAGRAAGPEAQGLVTSRATRARRFLAERLRERVAQQFDTSGSFLKRAMYCS